jgi:hypothetical protein
MLTINKGAKMDNNKLVVKNEEDSQKAFENAKSKGLDKPEDYMYMHSQNNKDFFKHIMFRNYISFNQ